MRILLISIGLFIASLVVGINIAGNYSNSPPVSAEAVEVAPTPIEISFEPTNLTIPKLVVNVTVERVGRDQEGRMDVPKVSENAGWWLHGAKPGETGSAVLAGHVDTPDGKPGIFYNLASLEIGDEIDVSDSSEKKLTFVVTGKQTYKDESFPIDEVFAQKNEKMLNLITCSGVFDGPTKNYSERLVVYSKLLENR